MVWVGKGRAIAEDALFVFWAKNREKLARIS